MRLEGKKVQQELKQGMAWPLYWIYGSERLLMRELVDRLRKSVVRDNPWAEEKIDGGGISGTDVVAAAQSLPFGGGIRFLVVRDAHLIKDPDAISELFGARSKIDELPYVCVLMAKDLDARKKFSKLLVEKAAVVACEAIPEQQRETWIQYLAGTMGVSVNHLPLEPLVRTEPWSLEWVESELIKWSLAEGVEPGLGDQVVVGGSGSGVPSEQFIESFLERREHRASLRWAERLGKKPEEALPLLGLLAWNVLMLALLAAKSRSVRLPPFLEGKLMRALRVWKLEEILALQSALSSLDFALKQTPQEPLALWGVLISQFCRN